MLCKKTTSVVAGDGSGGVVVNYSRVGELLELLILRIKFLNAWS